MTEGLALVEKLGTIGFGALMALVLFGSYFRIWYWGHAVVELKQNFEKERIDFAHRLAKEEQAKERWMEAALSATGLAEVIAKKRVP